MKRLLFYDYFLIALLLLIFSTVVSYAQINDPESIIKEADKSFEQGQFSKARALYQNALDMLQSADAKPKIKYQIGRTYFREKNYMKALETLDNLVKEYPNSGWTPGSYWLAGYAALNLNDFKKAVDRFVKMLEIKPNHRLTPDCLLRIGYCMVKLKRSDEAKMYFKKLVDKYPHTKETREALKSYVNLLWKESEKNPTAKEKQILINIIKNYKDLFANDQQLLGFLQMQEAAASFEKERALNSKSFPETIQSCNVILENIPNASPVDHATAMLIHGEALFSQQNTREAVDTFNNLLAIYGGKEEVITQCAFAQYMLGQCYYILNDWNKAKETFRIVYENYPDTANFAKNNVQASSMLWRGYILKEQKENENAKTIFEDLIKSYPASKEANISNVYLDDIKKKLNQ